MAWHTDSQKFTFDVRLTTGVQVHKHDGFRIKCDKI